jgi:dUTP pyrophosphatase
MAQLDPLHPGWVECVRTQRKVATLEFSGGSVLNRQHIEQLLEADPPLLAGMPDPENQIQPNGVDITLEAVSRFEGAGTIAVTNAGRVLPGTFDMPFDNSGFIHLTPGPWHVRFNEVVSLPDWLMAYARPRSSLLRSGVALHTAVWDAGYSGRGASLLVVYNPEGFRLQVNARIAQLVFHRLSGATSETYTGAYQHEGKASN